jgi:Putative phage metallopeptidase
MKKPKLSVIEPDSDAREILAEIRDAHHDDLRDATIELVWMLEPRTSKGKTVLGTCRVVPELWYRLAGVDIVVELFRQWWLSADGDAKRYLMDHELSHAVPKLDDDGHQEEDETGRKLWMSEPQPRRRLARLEPVVFWGKRPARNPGRRTPTPARPAVGPEELARCSPRFTPPSINDSGPRSQPQAGEDES